MFRDQERAFGMFVQILGEVIPPNNLRPVINSHDYWKKVWDVPLNFPFPIFSQIADHQSRNQNPGYPESAQDGDEFEIVFESRAHVLVSRTCPTRRRLFCSDLMAR